MSLTENFPYLSKDSTTSTRLLFNSRKFFEDDTLPYIINFYANVFGIEEIEQATATIRDLITSIPLSSLMEDQALYGYVDHEGDVIYPRAFPSDLVSVGQDEDGEKIYLQDFVAAALEAMKDFLNSRVLRACQSLNNQTLVNGLLQSPFFNFSVHKAYTKSLSQEQIFLANADIISNKFKQFCSADLRLNSEIYDFTSFFKIYVNFLTRYTHIRPVTFTNTSITNHYSIMNNSLTFKISKDEIGDDEKTYSKYYSDIGFIFFVDACKRFGFRFDAKYPFILHADLSSPNLQKFYQDAGMNTPRDVLSTRFYKTYKQDFAKLKLFLTRSYKNFCTDNEFYQKNIENYLSCQLNDKNFKFLEERKDAANINVIPDLLILKLYCFLRVLESPEIFSQSQYNSMYSEAVGLYSYHSKIPNGIEQVLKTINSKFNSMAGVYYFSSLSRENSGVVSVPGQGQTEILTRSNIVF